MCSPSYGCRGKPVVARMCVYTAQKNYLIQNLITKSTVNEQKIGMLLQKRTDTRGVGISNMNIPPYNHTHRFHSHPPPANHTHRFHPLPLATPASCSPHPLATPIHSTLSTIVIHTLNLCKVQSMDDNCAKFKVWMTIVDSNIST